MIYLLWGAGALVLLYLVRRFLGDHQQEKSRQYEIMEKRFRFDRRTFRSQWGKGMGSHFSLDGAYRGYPVRLYSHFAGEGKERRLWTSVTYEALFAGEREFRLNGVKGDECSRFGITDSLISEGALGEYELYSQGSGVGVAFWNDELLGRLEQLSAKGVGGSISLSKGFLEYRESGEMDTEEKRLHFQLVIVFLADVCDELSLVAKSGIGG